MRPSGKTNLIAVLVIGGVLYGIWWIVTFSGVYLDNLHGQGGSRLTIGGTLTNSDTILVIVAVANQT